MLVGPFPPLVLPSELRATRMKKTHSSGNPMGSTASTLVLNSALLVEREV